MINSKVEQYMQEVCSHIKYKKAHKEIRMELLNHIEEKTEELTYQNMTKEEAYSRAISEMGEADIIGRELNKTHKAAPEWSILIITILFTFIGLILTCLIAANGIKTNSSEGYLIKFVIFTLISYIILAALYFFDYKALQKQSKKIFIGTMIMLFAQEVVMPMQRAQNWLYIGPFSIDIGEVSLFLYAISLPEILKEFKEKGIKGYVVISGALFIPIWLYVEFSIPMEPLIYFVMFFMLMFIIKIKAYFVVPATAIISLSAFKFITASSYHVKQLMYCVNRIIILINSKADPTGAGYMYNQISTLLKSTGLWGNGFNFPKTAIPSVESEFILTYIIYTFGWVAAIIVIALILSFIARMFLASKAIKDSYGRLIIQSFMCIFAIEFAWDILMTAGFAPIVGITLPFISYGSSKLVVQMMAIGLIMSIYKGKSLSYIEEDMGKEKIES